MYRDGCNEKPIEGNPILNHGFNGKPIEGNPILNLDEQINTPQQYSFGGLTELSRDIPLICEALDVNSEDLCVFRSWIIDSQYMGIKSIRDRAIKKFGLKELPFIQINGLHSPQDNKHDYVGDGYVLYETRGKRKIRYVKAHIPYGSNYQIELHIIPKGQVYFFMRHVQAMNQICSDKLPPILEGNLLQDIINNTVGFLLKRKEIEKYGVKVRRGILLSGDAGNGKTMACRWIKKICTQNGIEHGTITAAEIERFFNEGNPLDELFNRYTVTFYDDIDIEYLNRKQGSGKIACSILSAMDGFTQTDHIIRIFTTNEKLNDLDPAFVRPGRIDRCFNINTPNADLRRQLIIERWPEEIKQYIGEQGLKYLILKSEGFTFAELESIRSILVTNKLVGGKEWDLYKAFDDFYNGRETFEKKGGKTLGFGK